MSLRPRRQNTIKGGDGGRLPGKAHWTLAQESKPSPRPGEEGPCSLRTPPPVTGTAGAWGTLRTGWLGTLGTRRWPRGRLGASASLPESRSLTGRTPSGRDRARGLTLQTWSSFPKSSRSTAAARPGLTCACTPGPV